MLKKSLLRVTPFFIISLPIILWMLFELVINRGGASAFGDLAVYAVLPFLAAMIFLDIVFKLLITKKNSLLWIIEGFCSLGFIYYWIVR